jgi:hypothetical protein
MHINKIVLLTFLIFVSKLSIAANPYSECGIGAALFPNTPWAAATSNATWDLGSTAVTSATTSKDTCSAGNMETAQFIIDNYDNLVEETAEGQGEHLATLLNIQGCKGQNRQGAIQNLRPDMVKHISSEDYVSQNSVDRAFGYYQAAQSAVATSCS